MKKKRIILLHNSSKPDTGEKGLSLLTWLEQRSEIVAHSLHEPIDMDRLPEADFVVVLGGDGTILSTARLLKERELPIVGVNMGKLGFLAEYSIEDFQNCFERIVTDDSLISRRTMLDCQIIGPGRAARYTTAVNELAIVAGPPFRIIQVQVRIGTEQLAVCSGDGLIVATPTGSTAYNLSAGGPIIAATINAAVITPLAAHSLSFRPIVVNLDAPIGIRCREATAYDSEHQSPPAVVAIDGQQHLPLDHDEEVIITRSAKSFRLVTNPFQSPWRLLNTKLNWGALPNYTNHQQS